MLPGEWKPVLAALLLPPTGPLLLALLGVLVAARRKGLGLLVATIGLVVAYLLGTHGMGLVLAQHLTPNVGAAPLQQVQQVQAIVVLGGGVQTEAPEYGAPQLAPASMERLRYGAWLARRTGKPLAFSGGAGWGGAEGQEAEALVARRVLQQDYGLALRWVEEQSRDTAENAQRSAVMLKPAGIRKIALVTDAIHMPRAVSEFRRAGFDVVPAPTAFPSREHEPLLEWLPSADGVVLTRHVLREWLARKVARAG